MKYVFKALMFSSLFFATLGYAEEVVDKGNIEEAEKTCHGLNYTSEQNECLRIVRVSRYFDKEALKICAKSGASTQCMSTIADKTFTATSVKFCGAKPYSSEINACLALTGHAIPAETKEAGLDRKYIRVSLQKALELMDNREYQKAQNVLKSVIESLE